MKILHVLDHSLPLHSGYTFRTAAILTEQRRRGWETVHLTSPKQGASEALTEQAGGFEFHRTPYSPGWLSRVPMGWPLDEMRATESALTDLARQTRPDVLHAHSPALNAWPALRVGRRLGIPVVYEVRAFWEDAAVDLGTSSEGGIRYRLTRQLETSALRRVDAVTTICEGLRADIVARGVPADRVTVIPNAVDTRRFQLITRKDEALLGELGLQGCEVIGFCGSFYAYEGLELLIDALPSMVAARPTIKVLLVGGGPQEQALRAQVERMGLNDRVVFTGRVPNAQIDRYYSLIDVLAYPRHRIRLTDLVTPLKPLEAMAQGRLLVTSDIGGHRELIEHGRTGMLFAPDDATSLAQAVLRLLGDPELQRALIAQGRAFVETQRNWPASVARYDAVYARLLAGREPVPAATGS